MTGCGKPVSGGGDADAEPTGTPPDAQKPTPSPSGGQEEKGSDPGSFGSSTDQHVEQIVSSSEEEAAVSREHGNEDQVSSTQDVVSTSCLIDSLI
jgi:hypothetical protein